MANKYFNSAINNNWGTSGNWWNDLACTIAAGSLPATTDDVFILPTTTWIVLGGNRVCANLSLDNATINTTGYTLECTNLTISSYTGAPLYGAGIQNFGTTIVTGDTVVTSANGQGGGIGNHGSFTVAGTLTLNGTGSSVGCWGGTLFEVTGLTIVNDTSHTGGENAVPLNFLGGIIYNDSSYNNSVSVNGNAIFNDNSNNNGVITGYVTCNTTGTCTPIDPPITYSPPTLSVTPTHYFNAALDNDWNNLGNWWQDADCTVAALALPTASDIVYATAGIASNSGDPAVCQTFIQFSSQAPSISIDINVTADEFHFYGHSYVNTTVTGNVICYNSSYHGPGATINGDAHFKGRSYCLGAVTGTITIDEYAIQKTLEQYMQHIINNSLSNPAASGPVVAKFLRGVNGVGLLGGA